MSVTSTQLFLVLDDRTLLDQCAVDHYRASGPGGQKRNKTSSAVRLRHRPTGLSVTASDDRSQKVNMTRALRRLREAIALHVRTPVDFGQASESIAACTHEGELRIGRRDARYFSVVAAVLDALASCEMRVSDAAELLGLSTGQLVKFIEQDPKVWQRVNQMRAEAGQKPLR